MFDPTAFENMKVVLEGIFYDKDIYGDITILDRNDNINTAKLSRKYDLTFQLNSLQEAIVSCKVILQAKLENLAAELLPSKQVNSNAGCILMMEYFFEYIYDDLLISKLQQMMEDIWGLKNRSLDIYILSKPLKQNKFVTYKIQISFDRILREDQMDDFSEMVQYILTTLDTLEQHVTKN